MKRVYYSFEKWEDYQNGMWRKVPFKFEEQFLNAAIKFTGDADLYGKYMLRAINEWPNGCEHNLTCIGMNRQAWVGHAATCIALAVPEYITRLAWHRLNQEQQNLANKQADVAIQIWEENYAKDKNWNRRSDSSPSQDFMDVRQIRESLLILQRREGQHSDVASSSGGSQETKKKIRTSFDRFGGSVQTNYGSCERLF